MDLLEVGNLFGSEMGYHGNIQLKTNGVGGKGRDRKPNFGDCSAWIISGWVVVAWWLSDYLSNVSASST